MGGRERIERKRNDVRNERLTGWTSDMIETEKKKGGENLKD